MKTNMGGTDKAIRLLIAVILVLLYFLGQIEGVIGIIALVMAAVFTLTSVISFCPLYTAFGIKTCKTKSV